MKRLPGCTQKFGFGAYLRSAHLPSIKSIFQTLAIAVQMKCFGEFECSREGKLPTRSSTTNSTWTCLSTSSAPNPLAGGKDAQYPPGNDAVIA
uniref:Uncharacterized protein n=1 Tax=Rhizophora mucronata TaxID=61149 RepID=A0A2P2J6Y7_RHIMU